MVNAGFAEQVKSYILDEGLEVFIFSGVCPNPTDVNVRDALMVWQENKCDLLVTLGGGSSHDCGKAMGIMATSGGDIRDYAGVNTLKSSLSLIYFYKYNCRDCKRNHSVCRCH